MRAQTDTLTSHENSGDDGSPSAASWPLSDVLSLHGSLLAFSLKVYPGQLGQLERVLASAHTLVSSSPSSAAAAAVAPLRELVTTPLDHLSDVRSLLQLQSWPPLHAHLPHDTQKEV